MRRIMIGIGVSLVASLFLAAASPAAEVIRLRVTTAVYLDGKGSGIRQPEGVGCGNSRLVVADTGNGRVLSYAVKEGDVAPGASIVVPQAPYPIRAQADSKGEIFVLDGKLRKIARLSPEGEFLGYVDLGSIGGGTVVPRSFRIDRNDHLYVLDVFSARVLVLGRNGTLQRTVPFPKEYGFFSDLAVDAAGTIFLIDSVGRRVVAAPTGTDAFSPASENLEEHVSFPTSLAVDGKGYIYVIDQNGSGIIILGPDGSFRGRHLGMGWKEGFLRYPSQACIDENGNFFIADRGNNRIEVLSTAR